jgi:hypothetical protein
MAFADEHGLTNNVAISKEDILPYLRNEWPECPRGGTYSIGKLDEWAKCSFPEHQHYAGN